MADGEKCFRDGVLFGSSGTAILTGLFFCEKRNWALVALGGLGLFLAKGGTLSAEDIPTDLPKAPGLPAFSSRPPAGPSFRPPTAVAPGFFA